MSDAPQLRDLPRLRQDRSNLDAVVSALTEAIQGLRGWRGDKRDRAVTFRDALEAGIVDAGGRWTAGGGTTVVYQGGGGGSTYELDMTPPPTPTGFAITAGITNVYLSCDVPVYTQGHGHGRSILYGAKWPAGEPAPTFAAAVRLWDFQGPFSAYPTEPATRWCMWLKWQSIDGGISTSPAGGINGQQATTAQDVRLQLDALAGSIGEGQLHQSLLGKINLLAHGVDDGALATLRNALAVHRSSTDAAAAVTLARQELTERITAGVEAEAQARLILASRVGTAEAGLISERTTRASQVEAVASDVTALQSTIYDPTTGLPATRVSLEQEAFTRATADGWLGSQWSVRMRLTAGGRTVSGGFGLSGTSAGAAGPEIEFGVLAHRFFIGAPDDGSAPGVVDSFPFVVQAQDATVNGVFIPKGVYMDAAYIVNMTAMVARIGVGTIDDAKIGSLSAAKLTVGDGTVGGNLKSANYSGGSTGWLLQPNGFAEFSNIVIRGATYTGTIYSGSGQIGGFTIGLHDLRSTNYVPGTTGLRLNDDGSVECYSLTARGNITANHLQAATGTFTGTLNGADGTFSGSLTASAINAIDTINLRGNSITVPVAGQVFSGLNSTIVAMSRTSRQTITVLTTSAAGSGNVLLWVRPTEQLYEDRNVNALSKIAVSGTNQLITYRWRVLRSVAGVETVVYERIVEDGSVAGTPTYCDFFGQLGDTPGPGVTAEYIYELYTELALAPTNINHERLPFVFAYVEFRR